jgi:hypothetical protein
MGDFQTKFFENPIFTYLRDCDEPAHGAVGEV